MQKGACRNDAEKEAQKPSPKAAFEGPEKAQFYNFSIGF
jgi:hypothetical protein